MRYINNCALPDLDTHFADFIEQELNYQRKSYDAALQYVTNRSLAIDIGAHVGFFSMYMMNDFESVRAFEPIPDNRECYMANMEHFYKDDDWKCFNIAASNKKGKVNIDRQSEHNSGGWEVSSSGREFNTDMIDNYSEEWNVGLVKIDVQGHELPVLQGMLKTMNKNKPVILIEVVHRGVTNEDIDALLVSNNYMKQDQIKKDSIYLGA